MRPAEFRRFLDRDTGCLHCGSTDDTLVPQHRANRGIGGSKRLEVPANIVVLCSEFNGLIESNALCALEARLNGWKLERHQDPASVPVFDVVTANWFRLLPDYTRELVGAPAEPLAMPG